MAIEFISDNDTRGKTCAAITAEVYAAGPWRIEKVKSTELETLWRLTRPDWQFVHRLVTNRYEESHQIMRDAYANQSHAK